MLYVERSTGESRISKLKVRKDDGAQKMSGDIMIWRAISCTLKRLDREVCTLPPHHFVETLSRNVIVMCKFNSACIDLLLTCTRCKCR